MKSQTRTDLQITRALRRIEGRKRYTCAQHDTIPSTICEACFEVMTWSPLTNGRHLVELIIKYSVHIRRDEEGYWEAYVPRRYGHYPKVMNTSLYYAVCFAILEIEEH